MTITTAAVLDAMGAAQPYAQSRPLRLASLALAPPGPGELLVAIEAAGLCHSDLSVVNADRPRPMPMALGHEAVARVVAVGAGTRLQPGDRVVLAFLPSCGHCAACHGGEPWLCSNGAAANGKGELLAGGCRLSEDGHKVHHHLGLSAFASHAVIDERSAVPIPDDIPAEIAALFGCAVLTGVGAVFNSAAVRPGESVAVWGLGGVGLAALMGAIAAGAEPVIAIDPVPDKRALALELGARAAVAPEDVEAAFAAHG
ncbi:alcohol dehydrogenase catalytic domain-containing protein, partial [Sandarakinorhabdus rubra]|uniref:alcohol dehydrogenase catalytic domain-containing protein n=1 Tax=Sandarakinorhabdus rubra TaxID=2672568 RepID=UPI0013DD73CF